MTSHPDRLPPRHLTILFLFASLLLLPAVLFGAGGSDMLVNCMKVRLFAAQFWHGDLYPRWLQDQFAGNGSPVFFYYPPLAYFITSFFIFLSPLDPFGYYPIAASVWLAAFVSGVAFYLWMRGEEQDGQAALIGSLLYMSAPVMIGLYFYYVMLFPSVWGWAWLPLLMLYARRVMQGRPYSVAGFALTLAALTMTNIPMTVIFGPMAVAYAALCCRRDKIVRQGMMLGVAVLLGFALSAIFLIPAAAYLDYTNARMFWSIDTTDYHHFLVLPGFGYFSQTVITFGIFITAALTLVYAAALRDRPKKYFFFVAASLLGIFMTLQASVRVWEVVPILKTLQFPERFFMVPSLCLAVLASVAVPRLRWLAYALMVLYAVCIFSLSHWDKRVTEAGLRKYNHWRYERFILNIDFSGLLTSPDLIPQYILREDLAVLDQPHARAETVRGDATAEVTRWRPRDIVLHYKATEPSIVRIWQFYFPGTAASEGGTPLETGRDERTGKILIALPPGEGEVHLELTQLLPEIIGKMISLVTAGIMLLWFLVEFRRRKGSGRRSEHS